MPKRISVEGPRHTEKPTTHADSSRLHLLNFTTVYI